MGQKIGGTEKLWRIIRQKNKLKKLETNLNYGSKYDMIHYYNKK